MKNNRELLHDALLCDFNAFLHRSAQSLIGSDKYQPNWHIDAMGYALSRCVTGDTTRLIITVPPRKMKSIAANVALSAWLLARDPSVQIIAASYNHELSAQLSRQFRSLVNEPWYRRAFPHVTLVQDTENEVRTSRGGKRLATSVGGSMTGLGADYIILDDPMKADDAMLSTARNAVDDWYRNTVLSRLNNQRTGVIILVMQRLHVDDLVGRILQNEGQHWVHLNLPAIAEVPACIPLSANYSHQRQVGDLLHPGRDTHESLHRLKKSMGEMAFSAQYQQRPVPEQGNLLKWNWFNVYDHVAYGPDGEVVQSWDTAFKAGSDNDYSVCTTWLVKGNKYYLQDVFRERLDYPRLRREITHRAKRFGANVVLIEDMASGQALIADIRYDRDGIRVIAVAPKGDKHDRCHQASLLVEAGQVYLPRQATWMGEFQNELMAFPASTHDDQVDSFSQFLLWIRDRQRNRSGNARAIYG